MPIPLWRNSPGLGKTFPRPAGDMGITVTNYSYGAIGGWMVDTQSTCPVIWHWYGRDQDEESALYGSYGKDAAEFDRIAIANPKLSIFVAAGNEREWFGEPDKLPPDYFDGTHCVWKNGTWLTSKKKRAGNSSRNGGYDTIAGAGLAKNVITVGAMRDLPTLWKRKDIAPTSFSSFGPADDGRIKPDVVANGDVIDSTAPPSDVTVLNFAELPISIRLSCTDTLTSPAHQWLRRLPRGLRSC